MNRYDSRDFKIYRNDPADPESISSDSYIYAIFCDKSGNLWIGTQNGLNRYIPESDSFERIYSVRGRFGTLSDNSVLCILQDHTGALWFGTNNGLSRISNTDSRAFVNFHRGKDGAGLAGNEIYALYEDKGGNIWVGTTTGLTRMTPSGKGFRFNTFRHSPADPLSISSNSIKAITEDGKGNLWIGTENEGLDLYQPGDGAFVHFVHYARGNSLSNNNIRKIVRDRQGTLWIGTKDGLSLFDPATRQFKVLRSDSEDNRSLSDNSIKDIYQDDKGSVWIGTMYGGINVSHPGANPFNVYRYSKFTNSISSNLISAISSDSRNNLWIGTEGKGLNYLDRTTGRFTNFQNNPADPGSLGSNFVKAILEDRQGNVWVGLHQGGLDLFLPSSGKFRHFRHGPSEPEALNRDNISCLIEDSRGRFLVGTAYGLFRLEKVSGRFSPWPAKGKLTSPYIRCMFEDSHHNLWVGTANGLNLLRGGDAPVRQFLKDPDSPGSILSVYINCITEDRRGTIWIGSYDGGLSRYVPEKGAFVTYTEKEGLVSNNVIDIREDKNGALWISTDKGLARLGPDRKKFRTYTVSDGLPANEFNYNSSFRDADGRLFFGSYGGLVYFQPDDFRQNTAAPKVVFTALKLFNNPVLINGKDGLLKKDISLNPDITFSHDQNIFTLEFASLSYIRPFKNRYAYKLEGFEKEWNYVTNPSATYTNLSPGRYVFLVRGGNNDGVWSNLPARLNITILPPPWKTWWAYCLYILAGSGLFVLIIRFFRRQARLERDLFYEHLNRERQEELYRMKLDFFTAVSHEIRTPLTLILAPIEKLIAATSEDNVLKRQLTYIKGNCDRLLRLISELLDFRKVETGKLKLQVAPHDLVSFCRGIYRAFSGVAVSRGINFHFHEPGQPQPFFFDQAQMEKVAFNILSNAFKFTPDGGFISLTVTVNSEGYGEIVIEDNGCGIPDEKLDQIFSDFYTSGARDNRTGGWGIGLALAKTITDLHHGSIGVESSFATDGKPGFTRFIVSLLPGDGHFEKEELLAGQPAATPYLYMQPDEQKLKTEIADSAGPAEKKYSLLIVEDNTEVREFIRESLKDVYDIRESVNGAEGWEVASSEIPDLIISDVAMPEMDGLELSRKIKGDDRTSHIPVVMLTARAAHMQQLDGLSTGADAYITKPFSMQILELTVRNLLLSREAMKQKFSKQVMLQPSNVLLESADEKFLGRLMKIIETRMEDPEFGVAALVQEIGMSQTVLYRKVKALTDLTITDFIKSVRLKQAAQLLRGRQLSIAEVAYAVGFNDRKYFSKEFRKQYGKAPSEFLQFSGD